MAQRFLTSLSFICYRIPLFVIVCLLLFYLLLWLLLFWLPIYVFAGIDVLEYWAETHLDKLFSIFDL